MDFIDENLERYTHDHSSGEGALLERLEKETYETLEIPQMTTGRIEGRLLKMLVQLTRAKRVVEVGTFGGYGSLSLAEGLPDDGRLFTCDIDPVAVAFARRFFDESPHGGKITLLEGDALTSLGTLEGPIDMAFIDADKENYLNYYEALLPKIRPGGLIVADNVLWSGRVLDPQDDSTRAICRFNDAVMNDARVECVMLTIRDGVSLIRKK